MPLTRKTKLKMEEARGINKKKKAITSRLLEITFKVEDYIYKHVPISATDAALYLTEVCGYKGECSGDKRSLQVIEKLERCMRGIIEEQQEFQDCNIKATDASLEDTIDMPKNRIESCKGMPNNQDVFIPRTMSSTICCSQVVENDLSWIENQRYDTKDIPKNRNKSSKSMPKNRNEDSKSVPKNRNQSSKRMPKNRNEPSKRMPKNRNESSKIMPKNRNESSKRMPKNRNEDSKSVPKNRNQSSKRMPKNLNESSKKMPNNHKDCIPRTTNSTNYSQVVENELSWIENQRYESKNMQTNRNDSCKRMPNNKKVFIPRTTSCSIYSQVVENDLSWVENLRYVREISAEEKLPVYYEDSFWEGYSLPSDWNNEEMFM